MSTDHRVLHVIDHTESGGAQVVVRYLLSQLRDRFSFSVAVLGESGEFSHAYRELGIPVLELGNSCGRWNPLPLMRLSHVVQAYRIDLIHTHLYKSHMLGAAAARLASIRSILHDHAGIYPRSLSLLFPRPISRYVYVSLYRHALMQYDRILVLTQSDREQYLAAYPSCHHRLSVLPNGTELKDFAATSCQHMGESLHRELGLPIQTKLVLMVARLDPQKDWFTFLETAQTVQEQLDQDCAFLVVGSGPEEQKLRDYAAAHNIGNVFFLKYRRDIPSLLQQANVFLLTSRREPFGIALLEAMAAGCPVVATRSGGPNSIVTNGVDGLLATVGDVQGLSTHVLSLLRNQELAEELAANGRETVSSYSVETVSAQMAGIYEEVLET